jgi:hypothetical protein
MIRLTVWKKSPICGHCGAGTRYSAHDNELVEILEGNLTPNGNLPKWARDKAVFAARNGMIVQIESAKK